MLVNMLERERERLEPINQINQFMNKDSCCYCYVVQILIEVDETITNVLLYQNHQHLY